MNAAAPIPALKEWATIVQALLAGEQIVDLRKGGIREPRRGGDGTSTRGFDLAARRAWLYPTAEHQRAELLRPGYRHWIDLAPAAPVGEAITIHGWADVVATATLTAPEHLEALDGRTIWTLDYAQSRLSWKPRDPLWLLVLRVHRLDEPVSVEWSDAYGGCTSWVELEGLPPDPVHAPSTPALSDAAFEARLKGLRDALAPLSVEAPPA